MFPAQIGKLFIHAANIFERIAFILLMRACLISLFSEMNSSETWEEAMAMMISQNQQQQQSQ